MKEITSPEEVNRLEEQAEDLGEQRTLKPFAKIKDDVWYEIQILAVREGEYFKAGPYHEQGEAFLEIEGPNEVVRGSKKLVWARQLYSKAKENVGKTIRFKKYRPEGKRYKAVKVEVV